MIQTDLRDAAQTLHQKGMAIRQISLALKVSRNTIRKILRGKDQEQTPRSSRWQDAFPLVAGIFNRCKGNVVRVQEILLDDHALSIPYSTLTRMVRDLELRDGKKSKRAGIYHFGPGAEMQHDTSPHGIVLNGKRVTAQCASLVLSYSRRLFIRYYPSFTRFEARHFLSEAFGFMDGTAPRCIIDNSNVIVALGTGPEAQMAPEMEGFGLIFSVTFEAHEVGDCDRKGRVERPFSYVEGNFLAGRTFLDWEDLNRQAIEWCQKTSNPKFKRSLGMSPDAAYIVEKPYLQPLPAYLPPVYQCLFRVVDIEGYVTVETNRYSVPERLVGKKVQVHKSWDRIEVFFGERKVADHQRLIGKSEGRMCDPLHHQKKLPSRNGPCLEEKELCGYSQTLDLYVAQIKKRSHGRAVRPLRRLLDLKRTYPEEAFHGACEQALHYGLFDLNRLEKLIIERVAGDFFRINEEEDP
jgi:transposase